MKRQLPGVDAALGRLPKVVSGRGAVCLALLLGSVRPAAAACDAAASEPWEGIRRVYSEALPFFGIRRVGAADPGTGLNGALVTLGAEIDTSFGLHVGLAEAPAAIVGGRIYPAHHLSLGYATERLRIAMTIGGALSWLYMQHGPSVRIGSIEGTHAVVRAAWSLYPAQAIPALFDMVFTHPFGSRLGLHVNLGGGYGQSFGVYFGAWATAGLEVRLGKRGRTVLSAGAGAAWMDFNLGPAVSLGVERRI